MRSLPADPSLSLLREEHRLTMCGINLIVADRLAELPPLLERMMQKTAFRGPDADGVFYHSWEHRQLALGANRLRITDAEEYSDQPFVSDCGNYTLAYNGEVYNFQDLKSALLRQGQEFRTASDTEVVLYWLIHNGSQGLGQLKGMFALVFIDLREEKIIAARDAQGIKPLFFGQHNNHIIISSALAAITATGLLDKKLNEEAIRDYLNFRHVLGHDTFFENIKALEPGTFIEHKNGELTYEAIAQDSQPVDNSLNLKEALTDALALTIATEQPAGLFLSGGVDSTLLLALYRHELGYQGMPTFTLNTGKDAEWAKKAAQQFDASHTAVEIGLDDLEEASLFLENLDQPVADHGALATWLIGKKAKLNHRVMLSGAGADELFAGYNRHRAFDSYLRHRTTWLNYKKFARSFGYFAHPKQLRSFLKAINNDPGKTFKNFLQIHSVKYKHQKSNNEVDHNIPVSDLAEALAYDRQNYLVNDVLAITDLATMCHGLEARVPYLYDDVVISARQVSLIDKLKLKGKGPLKEILNGYGGQAYSRRRKMGFGLPMADFMREKDYPLWSILAKDDPVFEYVHEAAVSRMKKEHLAAKTDWNMQLWSILVLSHWLKRNSA